MSELLVRIKNLAYGGDGVGEVIDSVPQNEDYKGITAFVPYVLEGELVRAALQKKKKNYIKTKLAEVLEPSPDRTTPPCPEFQNCGGCSLQHMTYRAQLEAKDKMIQSALEKKFKNKISDLKNDFKLEKIIGSSPFNYRRRISLHLVLRGEDRVLGFYKAGSRDCTEINKCLIANEELNSYIVKLQKIKQKLSGLISTIELDSDKTGVCGIFRAPFNLSGQQLSFLSETISDFFENFIIFSQGKKALSAGRALLEIPISLGSSSCIKIPAGSFSQVNKEINLKLIDYILKKADLKDGEVVEDLYAGAGNFTIPAALKGAKVISVEADKELSSFCEKNAKDNSLKSVTTKCLSVEKYLKEKYSKEAEIKKKIDLIIADPPRSGLGELAKKLGYAKKLILISCDLASFTRDLEELTEDSWQVKNIQPFDMFAQTGHVEIACILDRLS